MKRMRERVRWNRLDGGADDAFAFAGLHWMAAALFLAAGAEAALSRRRGPGGRAAEVTRWAPLAAAPLAGASHALLALRPGRASRTATRVLNGIAIGVGAAGALASSYTAVREADYAAGRLLGRRRPLLERLPPVAALTFAATGVLGLILDREEREEADTRRRLERRASVVERLVPSRKARPNRIVVKV